MKTGIEHIREQFNYMDNLIIEYLNEPNETNMFIAAQHISYLEGLAFAALMAHKENENDVDIAITMSKACRELRDAYYEKLRTK